jgi:hypothetical protein
MKNYFILLLFTVIGIFTCKAEQIAGKSLPGKILLSFSNENGVPYTFSKEIGQQVVGGFTEDSLHNIFIVGGEPTIIAKFNQQGKGLFRRQYSEFGVGQLYIDNGKVFIFNSSRDKNALFILNSNNGNIEKTIEKLTENQVNSYCFADGRLILHIFEFGSKRNVDSKLRFLVFDLLGKFIGASENPYNIVSFHFPKQYEQEAINYLGRYKEAYLFQYCDDEKYTLLLISNDGKVLNQGSIPIGTFGKELYGGIREFWSLHGELISVLGKQDDRAVITTIRVDNILR